MTKSRLPFLPPSRSTLGLILVLGLFLLVPEPAAKAAPDFGVPVGAQPPTGLELVAFEAPGCIYCPVFRRDVAPAYDTSRAGRAAPLRFVDLNDRAAEGFQLTAPITVVPTLVLMRDGVEIGRISGYVGPNSIHRILGPMLPSE